ncbi:hypothetical protein PVAG01_00158 [Phlyctema vagabunda]|uniref:Uncharacterized protein n=1 Tax=Phlyctema vagabunda TaxID=108571 RepID=A0ABR4PTH0_9HELO
MAPHTHTQTQVFTTCRHSHSYSTPCKEMSFSLNIFRRPCMGINTLQEQYTWGVCHDCRHSWQRFGISEQEAVDRVKFFRESNECYESPLTPIIFKGRIIIRVDDNPQVSEYFSQAIPPSQVAKQKVEETRIQTEQDSKPLPPSPPSQQRTQESKKRPESVLSSHTIWPGIELPELRKSPKGESTRGKLSKAFSGASFLGKAPAQASPPRQKREIFQGTAFPPPDQPRPRRETAPGGSPIQRRGSASIRTRPPRREISHSEAFARERNPVRKRDNVYSRTFTPSPSASALPPSPPPSTERRVSNQYVMMSGGVVDPGDEGKIFEAQPEPRSRSPIVRYQAAQEERRKASLADKAPVLEMPIPRERRPSQSSQHAQRRSREGPQRPLPEIPGPGPWGDDPDPFENW